MLCHTLPCQAAGHRHTAVPESVECRLSGSGESASTTNGVRHQHWLIFTNPFVRNSMYPDAGDYFQGVGLSEECRKRVLLAPFRSCSLRLAQPTSTEGISGRLHRIG